MRYRPFSEGAHSGNVRVEFKEFGFGNPDQTLDIPLVGQGIAPQICVNPTSIDFGGVDVGQTAVETVSITNCGGVGFTLRGTLLRAGTHGDFSVTTSVPLPRFFAPGEEVIATITAAPTLVLGP
ncbi:MAG: choice-of-anchor D domain-containing protein [Deltaproteobacteria bacterium]|nr:choice-of-anchor D domain-containing protein [Deltaproteobacteria bacterium]